MNAPGSKEAVYPVMLKLGGRNCLVVGGGAVSLRKVGTLLSSGAFVHAVSPKWCEGFEALAGNPSLRLSARPFEPSDLDGVALAIAATDDRNTQEEVARLCEARGIFVNVADVPDLCSFYLPAILRRGSLVVSVSTEGKSPGLAVAVRDRIASFLSPGIGVGLEWLSAARARVQALYTDDPSRRGAELGKLLAPAAVDDLVSGRLERFGAHLESWKRSL